MNCGLNKSYYNGYFYAISLWKNGAYDTQADAGSAAFDAEDGFDLVLEGISRMDRHGTAFREGYEDALRLFRMAKGL